VQAESATSGAGASVPGTPPRENLVRASSTIGLRGSESGMPTLTGHFAVWNQWTEIRSAYEGHFMERFAPASMTRTLEQSTPKVLFQHGKDNAIGEKPLGTVRSLQPDDQGAFYEVDLFDTAYNRELLPGLEAGAYGASFRFSVLREDMVQRPKKTDWNPRGIPERTVQEARVMEFGPVTFPAYAGATAGLRSMTDEFLLATLADDEDFRRRASISLAGVKTPFDRADTSDIACLSQMLNLGACYLSEQDETDDSTDIKAMTGVLHTLTSLIDGEIDETEPDEPDDTPMGMYSADEDGTDRDGDPEPSEATTPPVSDPEPSEATTRSDSRSLFWLADTPAHMKETSK
jgi:HK97 family phage prohead protease